MQCPACRDATLLITERQNIEIDYCPQCRGVWLDRGELDKLIERSAAAAPVAAVPAPARSAPPSRDHQGHGDSREYRDDGHRRKKREGFLSDLFDF